MFSAQQRQRQEAQRHPSPGQRGLQGDKDPTAVHGVSASILSVQRETKGPHTHQLQAHSPPAPGAASGGAQASLAPGPSPRGVSLAPEDPSASVSLLAVPGVQTVGAVGREGTEGEK